MAKKKVIFGLKKLAYAIITEVIDELTGNVTVTYGQPKFYAGAVKLEIDPQGDHVGTYADDGEWYGEDSNLGYKGKLLMAVQDDQFEQDVFGRKKDETTGLLIENIDDKPKRVALMYELTADTGKIRRVLYNVSLSRPKEGSESNGEKGKNFEQPEYEFIANPAKDTGDIKAKAETGDAVFENFYTAVPKVAVGA